MRARERGRGRGADRPDGAPAGGVATTLSRPSLSPGQEIKLVSITLSVAPAGALIRKFNVSIQRLRSATTVA